VRFTAGLFHFLTANVKNIGAVQKPGRMTILSCKMDRTRLTGGPGSPWLTEISPWSVKSAISPCHSISLHAYYSKTIVVVLQKPNCKIFF